MPVAPQTMKMEHGFYGYGGFSLILSAFIRLISPIRVLFSHEQVTCLLAPQTMKMEHGFYGYGGFSLILSAFIRLISPIRVLFSDQ